LQSSRPPFTPLSLILSFFFFFQAEDGIRDGHVTGVQTCALPICFPGCAPPSASRRRYYRRRDQYRPRAGTPSTSDRSASSRPGRSEERRVGKEVRYLWWRDLLKKKERGGDVKGDAESETCAIGRE